MPDPQNPWQVVSEAPASQQAATPAPAQQGGSGGDWQVTSETPKTVAQPTWAEKHIPGVSAKHSTAENILYAMVPFLGDVHDAAGYAADWYNQKMQPSTKEPSAAKTFALGVGRDLAGMAHGATSPSGVATTAASIAAPEIVGPVMAAHGIYEAHKAGVHSWGDLEDPDKLQNLLNAGAETASGLAMGSIGAKGIRDSIASRKAAAAPEQAVQDFKNAVPPSKSAPYTEHDISAARPYLEVQHQGGTPITSVEGLRDAADTSIDRIEASVDRAIKSNPNATIQTLPLSDAYAALKGNIRLSFLDEGMKSLEDYPLGFERAGGVTDPPLTLDQADKIRWQLNQENKAILKKNNYDVATARATDPGFAAREAVAESLRTGIYDALDKAGFKDSAQLRLDEGSLIKIRNAAQNQIFNAEKQVKTTAKKPGLIRRVAKKAAPAVGAATGFEVGATVGHPLIGASIGAEAGQMVGEAMTPEAMTRDALVERSFKKVPPASPRTRITPESAGAAGAGEASAQSEKMIRIRASDGSEHEIPEESLDKAKEIDSGLTVLNEIPSEQQPHQSVY